MAESDALSLPSFLDTVVDFPDEGTSYELLEALTDLRGCHDVTPAESRIVCTCRELKQGSGQQSEDVFVMKIKVQVKEHYNSAIPSQPHPGPSTMTSAELKAFDLLAQNPYTPKLKAFKRGTQRDNGPFPGGYLTFVVMTKMPGETLSGPKFWVTFTTEERAEIVKNFLHALRSIHTLGIEPLDRACRNILWDEQTRECSIIDFELWRETQDTFEDELSELRGWGLARHAPVKDHFAAWKMMYG